MFNSIPPTSPVAAGIDWMYAGIMLLSIVTGAWLYRRSQPVAQLTMRQRWAVGLGAFCGGMIGAKLPFVLADWDGWLGGRAWLDNGKTIMFGMVGGYFGVEMAKWFSGVKQKTGDSFAIPVAAAVGIGRLACLHAGCCFGTETSLPWACRFADGVPRHPTQLYESIFHFAAAAGLMALKSAGHFREQHIKLYFVSYFGYRFASEFIRPEPALWLGLTGYQWAAVAFIPLFVALWIVDAKRLRRSSIASLASAPAAATMPAHNRIVG
ncbi:MAG: prolipoprotein diacylglyceryl transferase [Planctomycetales bacterium]|nr:prolipoprotein diacylglyceryl transferase [Planctomycetales bacterium]